MVKSHSAWLKIIDDVTVNWAKIQGETVLEGLVTGVDGGGGELGGRVGAVEMQRSVSECLEEGNAVIVDADVERWQDSDLTQT